MQKGALCPFLPSESGMPQSTKPAMGRVCGSGLNAVLVGEPAAQQETSVCKAGCCIQFCRPGAAVRQLGLSPGHTWQSAAQRLRSRSSSGQMDMMIVVCMGNLSCLLCITRQRFSSLTAFLKNFAVLLSSFLTGSSGGTGAHRAALAVAVIPRPYHLRLHSGCGLQGFGGVKNGLGHSRSLLCVFNAKQRFRVDPRFTPKGKKMQAFALLFVS